MFTQDDVDAVLAEVVTPGVDKESLDVFHFVTDFSKKTFFVISTDLGNGGVGPHVLLGEVVTLLCPVGLELSDDWLPVVDEGDRLLCNLTTEGLLQVEA